MADGHLHVILAVAAFLGIVFLLLRQGGMFTGGRSRLPRQFAVQDVPFGEIPSDAKQPLEFLAKKLGSLGFTRAELPVRVPALEGRGYHLLLVPFANQQESTIFLMGIESRWPPRTELMLHIITPLTSGRRVETSTLAALETLKPPELVSLRVVLDAESVDEIWSRHRMALSEHERGDRSAISPERWQELAATSYEAWVRVAVRAQRLELDRTGTTYRVRRS